MRRCSTLALLVVLVGCAGGDERPEPLLGNWGGDNAALALGAGGGWIDLDCAWATIDAPLVLDSHGRFDLSGRHVVAQGPPPYGVDPPATARPARYEGWLVDGLLTIRVTVAGEPTVGPFHLRRREPATFARHCY